jgi:hypothetical protein
MFKGYFDESTDGAGIVVAVVAGWVAKEDDWCGFNQAWEKVLSECGIQEFHASYCESSTGEFSGWSSERCGELRQKLIGLILAWRLLGVACAINLQNTQATIGKARGVLTGAGRATPVPLLLGMQHCMVEAYRMTPDDVLQIVFDEHRANAIVPRLAQRLASIEEFKPRISNYRPIPGDSAQHCGLQAADLLANEVKRDAHYRITRNEASQRWILRAMSPSVLHVRYYADDDDLQILASEWYPSV